MNGVRSGRSEEFPEEFDGITEAKKLVVSLVLPKTFILVKVGKSGREMLSAGNREFSWGVFPSAPIPGESREKYCMNNIFWKRCGSATEPHGKNRNLDYEINI